MKKMICIIGVVLLILGALAFYRFVVFEPEPYSSGSWSKCNSTRTGRVTVMVLADNQSEFEAKVNEGQLELSSSRPVAGDLVRNTVTVEMGREMEYAQLIRSWDEVQSASRAIDACLN